MESKPDYLLATNWQKFSNVAVYGHAPRYNSDQFIVLCCLHILLLKEKKLPGELAVLPTTSYRECQRYKFIIPLQEAE